NSLGQVYLKRRDYRSAADEFEKIARQPRDVETQDNLVTALLHSRQYEKALSATQKLIEMSAKGSNMQKGAYQTLAAAHHQLGQSSQEQEALDQLRKLDPVWGDVRYCEMRPDGNGDVYLGCPK